MTRLSAFLGPGKSIEDGVARVRLAESLGYEGAWVIQIADREATIVASAYLGATTKINVGTGVLPMYPRTPVVMAQTAATLDEISGGRFILGLGTSHQTTIEAWHGMKLERPIRAMREYVGAVRAILRGETYFGEIYQTAFSFGGYAPLRSDLPIYISCLSPQMCRLAGEIADGAVLWMCAPNYIKDVVVPRVAEGRKRAGKSLDGFEVVAAVPVAISENRTEARDAFRRASAIYWSLPFYRAAIEGAGLDKEIAVFDREGPSGLSDEAVDVFSGAGDKDDCRRIIEEYRSAGVTLPALSPLPNHDGFAGIDKTLEALADI